MKKAIVKAKMETREVFDEKMRELGLELGPVIWQHDRVYLPRGYRPNMNLPRMIMRTEMTAVDKPAKYYLTLKRHISDSGIDIVDQTRVSDYVEAVNMIHQLGFGSAIEVSRRRQAFAISDNAVLYLDEVEKMPGYFLKIETKIEDNEKVSEVMDDLRRTLKLFGQENIVKDTYFDIAS